MYYVEKDRTPENSHYFDQLKTEPKFKIGQTVRHKYTWELGEVSEISQPHAFVVVCVVRVEGEYVADSQANFEAV